MRDLRASLRVHPWAPFMLVCDHMSRKNNLGCIVTCVAMVVACNPSSEEGAAAGADESEVKTAAVVTAHGTFVLGVRADLRAAMGTPDPNNYDAPTAKVPGAIS